MSPHFDDAAAEQYVLGALDGPAGQALEAHAAECDACARRLQREAALEDQLSQVARHSKRARQRRAVTTWIVGATALAASVVALVVLRHPAAATAPVPVAPVAQHSVPVPDGSVQGPTLTDGRRTCTSDQPCAAAPLRPDQVPQYESGAKIPDSASDAREPFAL